MNTIQVGTVLLISFISNYASAMEQSAILDQKKKLNSKARSGSVFTEIKPSGFAQLQRTLSQGKINERNLNPLDRLKEEFRKESKDLMVLKKCLDLDNDIIDKKRNTSLMRLLIKIQKEKNKEIRTLQTKALLILLQSKTLDIDWYHINKKGKSIKDILNLQLKDPNIEQLQKQINELSPDDEDFNDYIQTLNEDKKLTLMPRQEALKLVYERNKKALEQEKQSRQKGRLAVGISYLKKAKEDRKQRVRDLQKALALETNCVDTKLLAQEIERQDNPEKYLLTTSYDTIKQRGSFQTLEMLYTYFAQNEQAQFDKLKTISNPTDDQKRQLDLYDKWNQLFKEKLSESKS